MEHPDNIIGVCKECADKKKRECQKKNKDLKIKKGDFVKLAITDKEVNKTEHLWFEVIALNKNDFIGRCDNDAVAVKNMNYNSLHHFKFKDIEGYMERN